jgi:hypothetical protein
MNHCHLMAPGAVFMHEQQFVRALSGAVAMAAIGAALAMSMTSAQASEIYLKGGLPGVVLGYAHPLNAYLGLRLDAATIGSVNERRTEDGIVYDAKLKADRAALLADWFPFGGGFRFTGGITSSKYSLDLLASGAGGSITVGNTTYTTTSADRFNVKVKLPSSMPYVGLGWGHQVNTGLRFSLDIGAKLGKATLTYALSGPWTSSVSQADIDAELAELREGVGKIKLVPQLTLGLGYSF